MDSSVKRRTCVAALAMSASGPVGWHGSVGEMRRRMTTRQNAARETATGAVRETGAARKTATGAARATGAERKTATGAVRETGAARKTATGAHGCDICLALPRHAGSDQECHPASPQERQSSFSSGSGRA